MRIAIIGAGSVGGGLARAAVVARYAAPTESGPSLQVLLAGNDADAEARVAELASSLGFAPLDAGGLQPARSLEEIAFLDITLNATKGWTWQSAFQLAGPTA
jgi:predicted dinucleotide-binding enzyme